MSVICRKLLLKLSLRTYTFLKRSHASPYSLSICTEEIQAESEEWTPQTAINCNTFWLQSFGTCNSPLAKTKIYMLRYRYCFVTLYLKAISKYKPPRAYIRRGDLTDFFFFCVTSLGVLYLERLIFGILRYNVTCEAIPLNKLWRTSQTLSTMFVVCVYVLTAFKFR